MKSRLFAKIENGKIKTMTDSSILEDLANNEIPLSQKELNLLRTCNGDLELAKLMIRDIEERINDIK